MSTSEQSPEEGMLEHRDALVLASERINDARAALRLLLTALEGAQEAVQHALATHPLSWVSRPAEGPVEQPSEVAVLGAKPGEKFDIATMGQ